MRPQVAERTELAAKEETPSAVRTGRPLIIEAALLPEPGTEPSPEAPLRRSDYIREIKDCYEIGAAVVRVQPLARDSAPGNYHYDRSLDNYRSIVREVLKAAPEAVIDLDLEGAGGDVREWVRNNPRIELYSAAGSKGIFEAAEGMRPLEVMKRVIKSGGHVRLGLHESGVWPYRRSVSNLDYLRQAVSLAREEGRPVATPSEAREILQLPPLKPLYAVLSSETLKRGEPFFIEAIAAPVLRPFRAYAVFVTPNGKKYSINRKGKVVRKVTPYFGAREMKNLAYKTLMDAEVPENLPPGEYTLYLGIFSTRAPVRARYAMALADAALVIR